MIKIIEDLEKYSPKNEYSEFIKDYYKDILKYGTKKYISNIDVEVKILEVNGTLIPITFGNGKNNCYTTSINSTFKYLLLEAKVVKNIFLRFFIQVFSFIFLFIVKVSNLDKIIFVNNLLLSTNLYPKLEEKDFEEIKVFLLKNNKNYSIIFRSINDFDFKNLNILEKNDFKKIISRQIFISEKKYLEYYKNIRDFKNDKKKFLKNSIEKENKKNFTYDELNEIKDCYDNLYLKKYTSLNPQFTIDFFDSIQKNQFFSLNILKQNNEIKATYGYFNINSTITTPIFGYKEKDFYRYLSYILILETLEKANTLNQSSGVGKFKMGRGAKKNIEYFLVYFDNLSFCKKIIWKILYFFSKNFGEKLLKNNIY